MHTTQLPRKLENSLLVVMHESEAETRATTSIFWMAITILNIERRWMIEIKHARWKKSRDSTLIAFN